MSQFPSSTSTISTCINQGNMNTQFFAYQSLQETENQKIQAEMPTTVLNFFKTPQEELVQYDVDNRANPQSVTSYVHQIYEFLQTMEKQGQLKSDLLKIQSDINERMRMILIDWLIDVHQKYKLLPQTLFLTVSLIDRFLSVQNVQRCKLQLVGVAAMFIACKYEEIYSPQSKDFVYITDNTYSKEQIVDMESKILHSINFEVQIPTAWSFLERFCLTSFADQVTIAYAQLILHCCMLDLRAYNMLPSKIAAVALLFARNHIEESLNKGQTQTWTTILEKVSQYNIYELRQEAHFIQSTIIKSFKREGSLELAAIRRKFSQLKYHQVSNLVIL